MIAPASFLAALVFFTALDIYDIRRIDLSEVRGALQKHLEQKEPVSFPLPDELLIQDRSKKTVFVFGASNLVLSDSGRTFPDYLQQGHADLRVLNFGVNGIDSLSIKQRVNEALSVEKPDVIVLLIGDIDYNYAYHNFILENYYQKFNFLLRIPYFFYDKSKPVSKFSYGTFYWYGELNRPRLCEFFQRLGLIKIRQEDFNAINRLVLDYFIRNCNDTVRMAVAQNIPVVMITPVGNLHARPYGDINTTSVFYKQGMKAGDYARAISYLKKARDSEIFTYDLRAKSQLIDYIRNFRQPNVYVLDLEKRLEEMRFGFGYDEFIDYFHFNDKTHKLLADMIYNYMRANGLVGTVPLKKG